MKKKYVKPFCDITKCDRLNLFTSSNLSVINNVLAGCTEDTATPIKRLLPILVQYEDLEPDIKFNLRGNKKALNYRTLNWDGIDHLVVVTTMRGDDNVCSCDYTQFLYSGNFIIYYNVYDLLEFFLRQIRKKVDGEYIYHISSEVKKKMPTYCELLANADINEIDPQFGLPMISYLDVEKKYPLLCVCHKDEVLKELGDLDKLHIKLYGILNKMIDETNKAGLLDQSKKTLFKNVLRLLKIAHGFGI